LDLLFHRLLHQQSGGPVQRKVFRPLRMRLLAECVGGQQNVARRHNRLGHLLAWTFLQIARGSVPTPLISQLQQMPARRVTSNSCA
jgi:hypothetical protein